MNTHRIVSIVITMQLASVVVSFIKNIGAVPKNNPMVVNPNAKPGVSFSTDTKRPSVMDIVILNINTPSKEIIMWLSPNRRNGKAPTVLIIAVFLTPIKSEIMPPRAFPKPIEQYRRIVWNTVLFHDVGIPYPMYPLVITTITASIIVKPALSFKLL